MAEFGTKKKLMRIAEQLPDDATIEDAIKRLCLLAKIDGGSRKTDASRPSGDEEEGAARLVEHPAASVH